MELFTCQTEKKEAAPKLRMQSFLAQEARGCDYLILWLDCDKEGENICYEVINCVQNSMRRNIHSPDVRTMLKYHIYIYKIVFEIFFSEWVMCFHVQMSLLDIHSVSIVLSFSLATVIVA